MNNSNGTKIYPFDKDTSFAVLKRDDAIRKIEEQFAKAKIKDFAPTQRLHNKIQKYYFNQENKINLSIRNISTYIHQIQFNQDYVIHFKPKKLSHVNYRINCWNLSLWNIDAQHNLTHPWQKYN